MEECEFVDMDCPKNCGKKLKKKDLKKHLEEECPNRTIPCDYCTEEVLWNSMEVCCYTLPFMEENCSSMGKIFQLTPRRLDAFVSNTGVQNWPVVIGWSAKQTVAVKPHLNRSVVKATFNDTQILTSKVCSIENR